MEKHILSYPEFLEQKLFSEPEDCMLDIWNRFCIDTYDNEEGMIYRNDEKFLNSFDEEEIEEQSALSCYDFDDKFVTICDHVWESNDHVKNLIFGVEDLTYEYSEKGVHKKEYVAYCQQFKDRPYFIAREIQRIVSESFSFPQPTVEVLVQLLDPLYLKSLKVENEKYLEFEKLLSDLRQGD